MSTTLAGEVQAVLASQPDLGASGHLCRFTQSAAGFPQERQAAFQAAFVQDVARVLESFRMWQPGVCCAKSGREFSEMCGVPLGAAIVAMHIAGVHIKRIPGSADITIIRLRKL